MTTVALVEDSGTFVSTSQLLSVVANFFTATLLAALGDDTGGVHIVFRNGLHFRALCAQGRRESRRLGNSNDSLGGRICAKFGQLKLVSGCCSVRVPLQFAPQTVQVSTTFCLPALPSSRFPQSVQKTREPIADIVR